jgi:site-specific DNA-adenine methylase
MWGYYGSKSKIIDSYPAPLHDKLIEPFAGTAQYALKYHDKDITIVDKYEVITRIWQWLQKCSPSDITGLPRLKCGENVDDFKWDCEEAKWLVGFIITGAPSQPKKTASRWKTVIRPNTQDYKLKMISENLYKIRHWKIINGEYTDLANEKATWFIDPPYQYGGQYYRHGNKNIDFVKLADWCRSRQGQVIVCENSKADWMSFKPLVGMRGNRFKTMECIYEQ